MNNNPYNKNGSTFSEGVYYEKWNEGYQQALKDVGNYLDKNILSTDNRVTQLWVLAPTVKSLKQGELPKES